MSRLLIGLAGLGFELEPAHPDGRLQLSPEYAPFLQAAGALEPCARYVVHPATGKPLLKPLRGEPLWSCPTWRLGTADADATVLEIHSVRERSWKPVANLRADFSAGAIQSWAGRHADPSDLALNYPYDQAILMNRMAWFGAGVLHASGIDDGGRGLVFAGRSGAGKTTIARLWREAGARLLNDDRVIVRAEKNRALLASSPWRGEERQLAAAMLPLRAIFHLRQAERNCLTPVRGAESLARLLANAAAPFYLPGSMDRLLESWVSVAESVPSFELEFRPEAAAIELCRSALA